MEKRLTRDGRAAEILLIDDNRGDAILAAHAFKTAQMACQLTVASTGEIALAMLNQIGSYSDCPAPDLILLDFQLPMQSGLDVLRTIKSDRRFKHIPVIVMSNSGDVANVAKCYAAHANAYVTKPADLETYRAAIAAIEQFFFFLATLPKADVVAKAV